MDQPKSNTRRTVIGAAGAAGALSAIGFPAIVRSQSDTVRLGHLTPLTGFLGPLGEYAVMGVKLAVEEINAAGGINGRKVELIAEDSVNPQTASTKAERLIERDKVVAIVGEISSASGLAIAQVAQRNKILFFNTGCNSDELRGKSCNRYMFHTEAANSMYVGAAGQALLRDGLVKGKKWYSLTADYAFGHDLLKVAKRFMQAQWRRLRGRRTGSDQRHRFFAVPAENPQRQARSRRFQSGRRADQQLHEAVPRVRIAVPVGGFRFRYCVAWGAGKGNVTGIWPLVWDSQVKSPTAQRFTAAFTKKYGKPPENQAWGDYLVDQAPGAGDERHQEHRFDQGRRAHGERREVRCAEDARRLLPRVGPSTDAADVHGDLQARGASQGQVGAVQSVGPGAGRQSEPGDHCADARRKSVHDAGLIAE